MLANNVSEVRQLCSQLAREQPLERHRVLEAQDSNGFTPLLIAAARGFAQIARLVSTSQLHHSQINALCVLNNPIQNRI